MSTLPRAGMAVSAILGAIAAMYVLGYRRGWNEHTVSHAVDVPVTVIDSTSRVIAEAERITREATD